jgi:hypothetical protein
MMPMKSVQMRREIMLQTLILSVPAFETNSKSKRVEKTGALADDIYRPNLRYSMMSSLEDQEAPRRFLSNVDSTHDNEAA